jgi:hypothetical protein
MSLKLFGYSPSQILLLEAFPNEQSPFSLQQGGDSISPISVNSHQLHWDSL